jgi:hypothetical protein
MDPETVLPPPPEQKGGTVTLPGHTVTLCKHLSQRYALSQADLVAVALESLESHLEHTSTIQIPQLTMAVTDLREQVAILIGLAENLEQLSIELLASEMVPHE